MSDIVSNVSDFIVEKCDNGFILRYSGSDENNNWKESKRIVSDVEELIKLIRIVVEIPRN